MILIYKYYLAGMYDDFRKLIRPKLLLSTALFCMATETAFHLLPKH